MECWVLLAGSSTHNGRVPTLVLCRISAPSASLSAVIVSCAQSVVSSLLSRLQAAPRPDRRRQAQNHDRANRRLGHGTKPPAVGAPRRIVANDEPTIAFAAQRAFDVELLTASEGDNASRPNPNNPGRQRQHRAAVIKRRRHRVALNSEEIDHGNETTNRAQIARIRTVKGPLPLGEVPRRGGGGPKAWRCPEEVKAPQRGEGPRQNTERSRRTRPRSRFATAPSVEKALPVPD